MTAKTATAAPTVAAPWKPEFRRLVAMFSIGPGGTELTISAAADERTALARRFGLVRLDSLDAAVHLAGKALGAHARIHLSARVVQSCVVTLEPVAAVIEASFAVEFLPEEALAAGAEGGESSMEYGLDSPEPAEPITGGNIDLGSVITEYLSLAIDPYPRKPGVDYDPAAPAGAGAVDTAEQRPFSALSQWKEKS